MKRSWLLWLPFLLCLAIGLSAMAWVSITVIHLEENSRRQSLAEENIRLALWRMDSALSPLVAQETARPYFAYRAFTPAERAYNKMFSEYDYGEVLVPSPLLKIDSPLIRIHFQFDPDGSLTSPQVPTGNMRDIAVGKKFATREEINAADAQLKEFGARMGRDLLLAQLPANTPDQAWPAGNTITANVQLDNAIPPQDAGQQQAQQPIPPQMKRSVNEYQARANSQQLASNFELQNNRTVLRQGKAIKVREGVMRPLWVGDALVLARPVSLDEAEYVQGCWLNWPAIHQQLTTSVTDLLPNARLEPILTDSLDKQPRRLAAIPVRLIPGPIPYQSDHALSPIRLTLLVAWACAILGSVAVALLLWGALRLSERRGAFVSAVTHELRTPLTTVSMYAEMLEGEMVQPSQRQSYLATLRAEANRLGHLVENVLAYSRIERGRASARIQDLCLPDLIDPARKRLEGRAAQAGLHLDVNLPPDAAAIHVRADASAVEQILFNLVDNAAKYASSTPDQRLELTAERNGRYALIRLRDHGPGLSPSAKSRLFQPFSKSAQDAARSAPGVGLGLALSRRLARAMKGDLVLDRGCQDGACFVLTLPLV
jgi:signal transduction histidine kinase